MRLRAHVIGDTLTMRGIRLPPTIRHSRHAVIWHNVRGAGFGKWDARRHVVIAIDAEDRW
jgi:hypothetical protein